MIKRATATTSSCQTNWLTVMIPGPNKVVPNRLHGRALKMHVALIPKNVPVTLRAVTAAVAQSPSTAVASTEDNQETMSPHADTQECTHTASTERLLQQGTWAVEALRPSNPPLIRAMLIRLMSKRF